MEQLAGTMHGYAGPERRRHRVYITVNTEYHVRAGVCVAVRDRHSGRWLDDHPALGQRLRGAIAYPNSGGIAPHEGEPQVGESMYFHVRDRDLVTSRLERVERPAREVVARYPEA